MSYAPTSESWEDSFQRHAQSTGSNIRKIQQNVSLMQRLIHQLSVATDNQALKQQFHQIRINTQQLINNTNNSLGDLDSGHLRHLKLQRERLLDEFGLCLNTFQDVQKKFVEQEKQFIRHARETHHSNNTSDLIDTEPERGNEFELDKNQELQLQQEEMDLRALVEQERSIRELEENIATVNEIYSKLGALVYEQGTMVDSIEASVEQASHFVEEGATQLQEAYKLRNKIRRRKIMFCLIAIVLIVVIFLIIYYSSN